MVFTGMHCTFQEESYSHSLSNWRQDNSIKRNPTARASNTHGEDFLLYFLPLNAYWMLTVILMCTNWKFLFLILIVVLGSRWRGCMRGVSKSISLLYGEHSVWQGTATAFRAQFSIACHKTKTKLITLANHNQSRQSSKPIKTQSGDR